MIADYRPSQPETMPDATAARLVDIITGMLRELRPGSPVVAVHLDDAIETTLGLDSLSRLERVLRIEQAFNVRLPEDRVTAARTPRDLLAAIAGGRANAGDFDLRVAVERRWRSVARPRSRRGRTGRDGGADAHDERRPFSRCFSVRCGWVPYRCRCIRRRAGRTSASTSAAARPASSSMNAAC
jgi:acyl carrier protein